MNQGFSYYFCMMIEGSGSGAGSGSGSILLTSGSGSGRPKNMWIWWIRIRIRNTGYNNMLETLGIVLSWSDVRKVEEKSGRNRSATTARRQSTHGPDIIN
jgi:hypothetical protein